MLLRTRKVELLFYIFSDYFSPLTLKPEVVAAGFSSMLMLLGSMMRPKLWRLHACGICMVGEGTLSTATVQSMLLALTVAVAGSVSGILRLGHLLNLFLFSLMFLLLQLRLRLHLLNAARQALQFLIDDN